MKSLFSILVVSLMFISCQQQADMGPGEYDVVILPGGVAGAGIPRGCL